MRASTEVASQTETGGAVPALSVVVAVVSGRRAALERCLAALAAQVGAPPFETIVPYDDAIAQGAEVAELSAQFPGVRFVRAVGLDSRAGRAGKSHAHLDRLRTIGVRAARGGVIALTEDHAVTSPDWCASLLAELAAHPDAAAVGGAIECGSDGLLLRAVYYCDFGRYQNPLRAGPAAFVSDTNVAYRREALEAVREAWAEDYHEPDVHDALVARGYELRLTPRAEAAQARGALSWSTAVRERIVWGRAYAGARARRWSGARRTLFASLSLLLPFLLTARLVRGALSRGRDTGRFLACLPAIFVLETFWAAGEFFGYATGRPSGVRS